MSKKILQFLYPFQTVAVPEFIAIEKFVEGKTIDGVSIVWLGPNFKKHLLRKVERNVEAVELKVHRLLENARDMPKDDDPGIIPGLAGKHETMLANFHQLLAHKQQKRDFSWAMAYILCVDDAGNNILWAVDALWHPGDGGWRVGAGSVTVPHRWLAGFRVVSR